MALNFKLNWKPSPKDTNDHFFYKRVTAPIKVLPKSDLSHLVTMILNQGNIGSCVFNAEAQVSMMMQKKHGLEVVPPARLFGYAVTRKLEGNFNEDSGAFLRDAIKTYIQYGLPHEEHWPYTEENLFKWPDQKAFDEADDHQLTGYTRLRGTDDFRMSLSVGLPIMFGVELYPSFMEEMTAQTGIIQMPGMDDETVGGHAMTICGHDDKLKKFLGIQSWGKWGHGAGSFSYGFFSMPYAYIDKYCDEAWNLIAGEQL